MKKVRCAIYTRKSSEEGLEQDFNSLHAQREACAAYVASQASEGWSLNAQEYDDGGVSGGTLERPALQRLLADVAAGQIDTIVVYKVDRLTRSLLDFSKLVEAFDKAGVSFVSITQSFNTTTSMGRLTLNMLLSFAQFEREVTAERIRDKIAASKAKGMWMGGTPPLGYKPEGRSLVIAQEHAGIVRDIYARYLRLGNVRLLTDQLAGEGICSPVRERTSGARFGGAAFSRGQVYAILKNPVYAGRIAHKDRTFEGKHPPLIDPEQWEAVQRLLATHVQGQRSSRQETTSLLAGKIVGPAGEPLVATHSNKGKVRYRYYVTRSAHHDAQSGGMRIPAREIETLVIQRVAALFEDPLELAGRAGLHVSPGQIAGLLERGAELSVTLNGSHKRQVAGIVTQVRVEADHVEIDVAADQIGELLGLSTAADGRAITLTEHMRLTRTGRVVRLVGSSGESVTGNPPDATLVALVVKARRWWSELAKGEVRIEALARQESVSPSYMIRVVRLAFLAPAVVEAILDGNVKAGLTGAALLQTDAIAACWREQEARCIAA